MTAQLIGADRLIRKLDSLPGKVHRKVVRQAVNKSATPLVKAARRNAPRETGLLAKSMGKKLKSYFARGVVLSVLGPRKGQGKEVTLPDGATQYRDPVKYAHLVEFGTAHSPATGFMRRAYEEQKGPAMVAMQSHIKTGIEREAAKS